MLLFRSALTADSGAIADIDQVAELSLDKRPSCVPTGFCQN